MKKKFILGLLVVVALFTITGCGSSNNNQANNKENKNVVTIQGEQFKLKSSTNLYDLHYKENYVDFHTDRVGNIKMMSYSPKGNTIFEIRIMYDETRSIEELKAILKTQTNATEKSKEIKGIKYIYYEYTDDNDLTIHHYMYVHKGKAYSIGFFLGKDPGNIEEVFMNNVAFK